MKTSLFAFALLTTLGCQTMKTSESSSGSLPPDNVTVTDPESDIAPASTCKTGEVERMQSGKVVCMTQAEAERTSGR